MNNTLILKLYTRMARNQDSVFALIKISIIVLGTVHFHSRWGGGLVIQHFARVKFLYPLKLDAKFLYPPLKFKVIKGFNMPLNAI